MGPRALIEPADPFAAERPFLAAALGGCSLGVAVFDLDLLCVGVNASFPFPAAIPAEPLVGKTVPQIFGPTASLISSGLERVRDTGSPVRDVELSATRPKARACARWIVDFFPVGPAFGQFRLIGTAFSKAYATVRLEGLIGRLGGGSAPADGALPGARGRKLAALSGDCADSCRRTIELLELSQSLRRRISEVRLAAGLAISPRYVGAFARRRASKTGAPASALLAPILDQGSVCTPPASPVWPGLVHSPSPRELQVVDLLADGKSNKEIAAALELSIRTVETYRARLMSKLKVHSAAELVRYAIRYRLIEP